MLIPISQCPWTFQVTPVVQRSCVYYKRLFLLLFNYAFELPLILYDMLGRRRARLPYDRARIRE